MADDRPSVIGFSRADRGVRGLSSLDFLARLPRLISCARLARATLRLVRGALVERLRVVIGFRLEIVGMAAPQL